MGETEGGQRLNTAIRAALETASQAGRLQGSARDALEATLARLDRKLGREGTDVHFRVEAVPDHVLLLLHSSDPVATDVIASFMHHAGANKLGTAKGWLLPLQEVPVNRWLRALRRVLRAEQRTLGDPPSALPVRLTAVWARQGELVVATVG